MNLEEKNGYPHHLTFESVKALVEFVTGELNRMALEGRNAQNTGLPLTQTQKERLKNEQAQKRAAAAKAKANKTTTQSGGSRSDHRR